MVAHQRICFSWRCCCPLPPWYCMDLPRKHTLPPIHAPDGPCSSGGLPCRTERTDRITKCEICDKYIQYSVNEISELIHPSPTLLIISLELFWTRIILFHGHPQVVYYNCVNFHQYRFIC